MNKTLVAAALAASVADVQVDLGAVTTMVNLQLRGYVRIGG